MELVDRALTIGQIAGLAGVTVKAVRHYHRVGLLEEPPRAPNGYRCYSPRHLVELLRIRRLRAAGMSLASIREVLEHPEPEDVGTELKRLLVDLEARKDELESRVRELKVLVAAVDRGDTVETSDVAPPTFLAAQAILRQLGASDRLLEAERRVWALLDTVSWPSQTRAALGRTFKRLESQPEHAGRVAELLSEALSAADDGASAEELLPVVRRLLVVFPQLVPPERQRPEHGETAEQWAIGELILQTLPPALREAIDIVIREVESE